MPEPPPPRQLLDRQEIMAAMAAYARCADQNEPERQTAVFVDDCLVRYHPAESIIGRAALVRAVRQALGRHTRTSHHLSNIEIDFEGPDSAAAQSTVIAPDTGCARHRGGRAPALPRPVHRADVMRRVAGSSPGYLELVS